MHDLNEREGVLLITFYNLINRNCAGVELKLKKQI